MNQNGLSTVLMLSFLPILMSALLLFFALFVIFQLRAETQYICQNELLKTQNQNEKSIQQLFALNPKALKLRAELISLKARLLVAIAHFNFPAITLIKIKIGKVELEQKVLEIEQKNILYQAEIQTHQKMQKAQNLIRSKYNESTQLNFFLLKIFQLQMTPIMNSLAVEKLWSGNGAAYQRKNNFSEKQILTLQWSYQVQTNLKWVFAQQNIQYKNSCSATIEQKGLKWISNLKKVKY